MNILNRTTAVEFSAASHEASALALAGVIGHKLDQDFVVLAQAKADYQGGPFRVMFNMFSFLTKEQIESIPDHEAETGNNPRFYKTKVLKADGKEKMSDRDYYKVMAEGLPDVIAKQNRIELLGRSMKDPTKFNLSDIPEDIKDMSHARRHAQIKRLTDDISTARTNVVTALELYSQMQRFHTLPGVEMALLYKIDNEGKELDGSDGKAMVIDDTRAPIVITSKLERRRSIDTANVSVSSFMKFDVPKAKEQGGSWDALLATVKKGTKEKDKDAKTNARNVETLDTAQQVATDFAEYLVRIQDTKDGAAWEALNKAAHGAGSDDFFMNLCWIKASLDLIVGNPKDQVRFQSLINKEAA